MKTPSHKLENFLCWLDQTSLNRAEIMPGFSEGVRHLRLDKSGLAERGWNDLSIHWQPPEGELWAGGYMEDRSIYDSPVFATKGEEPRTLHLGLDVFTGPGKPVFAPLEGAVHSLQINGGELDYGPTILLEHTPQPDLIFWTLYGHLSEESLIGLEPGDPVSTGEKLAELGANTENGGWSPHLHFQIILDLQGREGDFPGVCRLSEAQTWKAICPDPAKFLGLRYI